MAKALVTGILGQDGTYLARLLDEGGHEVEGVVPPGLAVPDGFAHRCHVADLAHPDGLAELVADIAPDLVFNLAGLSSVAASWDDPVTTMAVNATGAVALLEASARRPGVRFVQASSAEIFGQADITPQDESTPLRPTSPYGVSKAAAHLAVGVWRQRGVHASSLILYNHESPLRPAQFVTRKITSTVARIARGEASELRLGNLDARRDWGWAPDYARAMLLAAQADEPGDYVIATGVSHSVRDFVGAAFAHVGITDWERYVVVDPAFFRPADPAELRGDASRARTLLGWAPTVAFEDMVAALVDEDGR